MVEIENISYTLVSNEKEEEIWKLHINNYESVFSKRLVGNQLKYIISKDNNVIACYGVVSSAFAVKDRDNYIKWSTEERKKYLKYLLRLQCYVDKIDKKYYREIMEEILIELVQRILLDFKIKYKYEPIFLEYFVENDNKIISLPLLITGWKYIGSTAGIGKDGTKEIESRKKRIYLYEYSQNYRNIFKFEEDNKLDPSSVLPKDELKYEFSDVNIGDKRRNKLLIDLVNLKYKFMGQSIAKICEGNESLLRKFYRFLDNKSKDINFDSLQYCHRINSIKRMNFCKEIKVIVDASDLNFENLKHCTGLGVISVKKGGSSSKGIRLYTSMAFDEHWIPLGIIFSKIIIPMLLTADQKKIEVKFLKLIRRLKYG